MKVKAPAITEVTLRYDLFDLPTAQHKAGLAGLVLQIRSMVERAGKGGSLSDEDVPRIDEVTATSATITFTQRTVQALFDDLYAAEPDVVAVRSKWPGQPPKSEKEIDVTDEDGKVNKVKHYLYDVTKPCGRFLRQHLNEGPWLKLWRDMLWAIPRGNPQARRPFEECASGLSCKEGRDAWDDLVKVEQAQAAGRLYTAAVAGSLWLGAQATNAEAVPFVGRAEQNLLLHFWPLTTLIFVPRSIDVDGVSEFVGYVLAIPEVSHLEQFLDDYPRMLGDLSSDVQGYRPAEAVIDLPAQGALVFLEHLSRLVSKHVDRTAIRYSVGSIEFLHLEKKGNNIKSLAAGRIAPRPHLLEAYEAWIGTPGRPSAFRNPLFRRGLMLSFLNGINWYEPMEALLAEWPAPLFVRSAESPRRLAWFWHDAKKMFDWIFDDIPQPVPQIPTGTQMDSRPQTPLELIIYRLVQTYVNKRTKERCGQDWDDFKDNKIKDPQTNKERVDVPEAYREAREKVALGIFLELRSRREQAFVDHFTATFCSVKQFLREEEFQNVATALIQEPERVKTLTLLALSANS